jgi:hypothetical protein
VPEHSAALANVDPTAVKAHAIAMLETSVFMTVMNKPPQIAKMQAKESLDLLAYVSLANSIAEHHPKTFMTRN